jgi:hypothetical protein
MPAFVLWQLTEIFPYRLRVHVFWKVESRDQIQKEISRMHIKSDMGIRTRAIILAPISLPFATRTKIVYPLCLIFDNAEGMSFESGWSPIGAHKYLQTYFCEICPKEFTRRYDWNRHRKSHCKYEERWVCPIVYLSPGAHFCLIPENLNARMKVVCFEPTNMAALNAISKVNSESFLLDVLHRVLMEGQ